VARLVGLARRADSATLRPRKTLGLGWDGGAWASREDDRGTLEKFGEMRKEHGATRKEYGRSREGDGANREDDVSTREEVGAIRMRIGGKRWLVGSTRELIGGIQNSDRRSAGGDRR